MPPDIITYRFRGNLVYVKPELDYKVALNLARSEFVELHGVSQHQIVFITYASVAGQRTSVRISASAWASTVSAMLRGEIVDIEIMGNPDIFLIARRFHQYLKAIACM
ncbi:uncharacterized protein EV420DRAFT_211996 [Desarmillaria tabescens]|uniref:Uncharacterized protein n=1 Tax=Armillaria tabescens TaxID=1929756 RepID=A0AA39N7J6_ARMTA|nr:uncharacterized protein EV420DRAFT_211996 [Desarmillaria tabescens]KAK0460472.1 hypothetical protein EV420DRAFT_211996 [Desarmillaria tabescens]